MKLVQQVYKIVSGVRSPNDKKTAKFLSIQRDMKHSLRHWIQKMVHVFPGKKAPHAHLHICNVDLFRLYICAFFEQSADNTRLSVPEVALPSNSFSN